MIDLVEPELGDLFPGGNGGMLIAETTQGAQMMPFQLREQEWNNMLIKNAHHLEFGVCVFLSLYSDIFRGATIEILFWSEILISSRGQSL